MSPTLAIGLTLVGYKIALVVIGLLANRRTHDSADFFLGGRTLGPFVAAISASASSSSAWTLLGVSGAAYAWGLAAVWIFPACLGGFVINWYVLAPRLRAQSKRSGTLTVTEILAGPLGSPWSIAIRWACTIIVLLSLLAYVAAQFQGAGKAFSETFGWSMESGIVLGSAIVVLYTMLGGFWAVSVTDTLQGLMMAAACVLLPVAAIVEVGGVGHLLDALAEVPVEGYASLGRNLQPAAAFGFTLGLLGIGLGYPGQPHVVNRFMALRDDAAVVRGRQIALAWGGLVYAGMLVLGWCARVLYPGLPDGEVAFITATQGLFPPVVAGVMLAAVLSAIMSTADSQLLVAASSVVHDLPGRWRPGTEHGLVARSRLVVGLLSVGAIGAALWGDATIFKRVLFAWTAMGAAFGPLLLVLVVSGPVRGAARLGAIVIGFAAAVIAYSIPATSGTAWERVLPFVLALAVAAVGRTRGS